MDGDKLLGLFLCDSADIVEVGDDCLRDKWLEDNCIITFGANFSI